MRLLRIATNMVLAWIPLSQRLRHVTNRRRPGTARDGWCLPAIHPQMVEEWTLAED
jgi:hypothetical protein